MDSTALIAIILSAFVCLTIVFNANKFKLLIAERDGSQPYLKICRHCGGEVLKRAITCPQCGGNVQYIKVLIYKVLLPFLIVLLIEILLLYIVT